MLGGLALAFSAYACGGSSHTHGGDDDGANAGETSTGGTSGETGGAAQAGMGGKSSGGSGGANGGDAGMPSSTGGTGGSGATGGSGGTSGAGGTGGSHRGGAGGSGGSGASAGATPGGSGGTGIPDLGPPSTDYLPLRPDFTKLDLLFMVDNSISMTGKQQILAEAVPNLVRRLTQPDCVDATGAKTGAIADQDGTCADGQPALVPVTDLHVGVITSSLGDHGSNDACSDAQNTANGGGNYYNDLAQLLPSVRPSTSLYSWNNAGFLVWDPRDQATVSDPHTPVTANETSPTTFAQNFATQITAATERGCGYEASLEAWYRFLVDPQPITSVTNDMFYTVRDDAHATNSIVLQERQLFLRDDSVLGIVMLTDENDCSIVDEDGTQGWLVTYKGGVGALTFHLPFGSSACTVDPNDPCCRPCTSPVPAGCAANDADPVCGVATTRSTTDDSMNLRCFQQVQRFGISLLYPTLRYVEALTKPQITPRFGGATVPNPLFTGQRTPTEVMLLGIIGVPWQDISTEDSWSSGHELTYMTAQELADGNRWSVMLGDPDSGVHALDTLMVESIDPRTAPLPQTHPLLPDVTIGAATATSNTNPINGHEQATLSARDDLQFACIFPLEQPLSSTDCAADSDGCDCNADEFPKNSPLCTGVTATSDGSQGYGKAYPGLRELQVLKGLGNAGVVASICPKITQPTGSTLTDDSYGYNPALAALVDRLAPTFLPTCLPTPLTVAADDPTQLECQVGELSADPEDSGTCDCSSKGLTSANEAVTARAYADLESRGRCGDATVTACESFCVCDAPALTGDALKSCLNDADYTGSADGYCYVDPGLGAGSADLVNVCPVGRKRTIRWLGSAPTKGMLPFIDCAAADQ